ncbi:YbcC family protein [Planctobacterium marinum]|uniref:Probable inorganic carbon transporter subunit DabA n=1 Tax=Planctobacterium marinum TaxID=1631968 RepID=A0AA48I2L9_9ALTE|nr:UPF0753 protein [Planctobacterium marinum]
MNTAQSHLQQPASPSIHDCVADVCTRIAPNWPLDKLIAVNPYWELKQDSFSDVAIRLAALAGVQSLMPKSFWIEAYQQGKISDNALQQAALIHDYQQGLPALKLTTESVAPASWKNLSGLVDQFRTEHQVSWHDEIIQQISQFCAAFYQSNAILERIEGENSQHCFYKSWRNNIIKDNGIGVLMGETKLAQSISTLPESPEALFEIAMAELEVQESIQEDYLYALLLDINGWAAYVAYRRWQNTSDDMMPLLAVRLAWELIIWRHLKHISSGVQTAVAEKWQQEQQSIGARFQEHHRHQKALWVWHTAHELTQQQQLQKQLRTTSDAPEPKPTLQAVFCIDVRSEIIRRALEQQDNGIETRGFAGFFGMPVAYAPTGTKLQRPQLPGLLAPQIDVSERTGNVTRLRPIKNQANWLRWSYSPTGSFSLVESAGWWYGFKLLKNMWFPGKQENPVSSLSHESQWQLSRDGETLSIQDCAELAKGILGALGIQNYAEQVLLVGHASCTTNNLHAAGLDCGACGGQSGEVNVRILTQLLNNEAVRVELKKLGITIPDTTHFVAALHNTTTDEISCFDDELSEQQRQWLRNATQIAQLERTADVDEKLAKLTPEKRQKAYRKRSYDWSQVRPEWGLAGNHSFIIAPRQRTKALNLKGKVFLHDYDWQNDSDYSVLELLITAPMVVTNWINMQYNASVTDNLKWGCGNKVLHNAVAGNIGVFEGNGGDLRIGLSMQSLHDGKRWMHTPQRLSVYIAAPQEAIEGIVNKHSHIKQLIDNDWLYLFSWQETKQIHRLYKGDWITQEEGH